MYTSTDHHHAHGWKQHHGRGHYGWHNRRHGFGWPALLLGVLFLAFLAGPVIQIALFFVKVAFALLPFILIGGLIAFGVRARARGHGRHEFHGDWDSLRHEFRDRFHNESKRWKDYRDYRQSESEDRVVRDSQDGSEIYHI